MWLDLRLHGLEPESLRPDEKSLLMSHLARQRELRYVEIMLIVKAIVSATNALNGKDPGNSLQDLVKEFTDLCFPEKAHDLAEKASRIKTLLEKEAARGPMKVQAQEYGRKRNRRKR